MADFALALTRGLAAITKNAPGVPVRGSQWGWVREPFAGGWQRGAQVNPMGSLVAFSPVYACIARKAGDIAKLGILLKKRQDDGTWQTADDTSPFWATLRKPNAFQIWQQFIEFWIVSKAMYGNAYALKQRDGRGMVSRLWMLDPRRVTPLVTPDGSVYYSLSGDDLSRIPTGTVAPASEVIHDRGPCLWHPLVGISPIYACALAATQGQRIQANSEAFFRNMSRPSGVLTAPDTIDDVTAERLRRDWNENFAGDNIGRLGVLGDGLKYEAMSMPAEASQLIDQLKWTVEDVARAFSMPLYKIGAGPVPTANNVQSLQQQYHSDCLQTDIEAIEALLDAGLALPPDMRTEVDLDGLLRMDSSTQIEMLSKAIGAAIMKPNEARRKLNLPHAEGGDALFLQQQNYSLEALAKRDASDDPFGRKTAPTAAPVPEPAAAPPAPEPGKAIEAIAAELVAAVKAAAPPTPTPTPDDDDFERELAQQFEAADA